MRKALFKKNVYLFILRERKQHTHAGEEERENPKQAPSCQRRAQQGAQTHEPGDHELSQIQESDA